VNHFHQKSFNCYRMNSLWQHTGYLTKYCLDLFPGIRDQKVLTWFMSLFGVTFLVIIKIYTICFAVYLFILVISIGTIAIYNDIFRQIKDHVFHSFNIVITPRKNCKFTGIPLKHSDIGAGINQSQVFSLMMLM
jgi:hypothetical protein